MGGWGGKGLSHSLPVHSEMEEEEVGGWVGGWVGRWFTYLSTAPAVFFLQAEGLAGDDVEVDEPPCIEDFDEFDPFLLVVGVET